MPTCYLLPGLMGSQLAEARFPFLTPWVSYTQIALGQIGKLRLANDGVTPGPPDGVELIPFGLMRDYYLVCEVSLRNQLAPNGYKVVPHDYDWRLQTNSAGVAFANQIMEDNTSADPCAIVAHSMGGFVTLAAWRELQARGLTNLVRRVITLGTPFLGSYRPVLVFSRHDELIDQIRFLSQLVRAVTGPMGGFELIPPWTRERIVELVMTWPAIYELLPVLNPTTLATDPHREALYKAANWPAILRPSQKWLTHASAVISPWLSDPASYPPPDVLTTVAGSDYPTPFRVRDPHQIGTPEAIESTTEGDGMVTVASATYPSSARVIVQCPHVDLVRASIALDLLPSLVLASRPPLPTPPTQQLQGGVLQRLLSGPPFTGFVRLDQDC